MWGYRKIMIGFRVYGLGGSIQEFCKDNMETGTSSTQLLPLLKLWSWNSM